MHDEGPEKDSIMFEMLAEKFDRHFIEMFKAFHAECFNEDARLVVYEVTAELLRDKLTEWTDKLPTTEKYN